MRALLGLEMRRVKRDEAHPVSFDALHNLCNQLVFNQVVLFVAPPNQHVRAVQQFVRQPLIGLADVGHHHFPTVERLFEAFGHRAVNVVRIDPFRSGAFRPDHHAFLRIIAFHLGIISHGDYCYA
jgi:hypothetical protein